MGSSLIVGSVYHKNTNAKVDRANGVISDTLQAYANGGKDVWDKELQFAEFAINNTVSTLGGEADMTPFFIPASRLGSRHASPRTPPAACPCRHCSQT